MSSHFLWLVRDSDDLVNWCRRPRTGAGGLVGCLPQLDLENERRET